MVKFLTQVHRHFPAHDFARGQKPAVNILIACFIIKIEENIEAILDSEAVVLNRLEGAEDPSKSVKKRQKSLSRKGNRLQTTGTETGSGNVQDSQNVKSNSNNGRLCKSNVTSCCQKR